MEMDHEKMLLLLLAMLLLTITPLWAAEDQPSQARKHAFSGYRFGTEGM